MPLFGRYQSRSEAAALSGFANWFRLRYAITVTPTDKNAGGMTSTKMPLRND